ncbi:MAG: T9SS type A sorting domain-containing protein, partial [Polaribacter sp.]
YINENYFIYLLDTENDVTIDLRQISYDFSIETIGENNSRFKIIYTKEEIEVSQKSLGINTLEDNDSKNLRVFIDNKNELNVAFNFDENEVKKITLFSIQGKKVVVFNGDQKKNVSNISKGVYIVKVQLEDNKIFNKKIVISN